MTPMAHLAHHAAPGRHELACDPLRQLEAIRGLCASVGHTGDGSVVEAVAEVVQELILRRHLDGHATKTGTAGAVTSDEWRR